MTRQQEVQRLIRAIKDATQNPTIQRATDELSAICALNTMAVNDDFLMRLKHAASEKYGPGIVSPSGLLSCAMALALDDCQGCSDEGRAAYVKTKIDTVYREMPRLMGAY